MRKIYFDVASLSCNSSMIIGTRHLSTALLKVRYSDVFIIQLLFRSPLHVLLFLFQFFKSRGQRLRVADINKSHVGQKDVQKSHFTVWDEIFRVSKKLISDLVISIGLFLSQIVCFRTMEIVRSS